MQEKLKVVTRQIVGIMALFMVCSCVPFVAPDVMRKGPPIVIYVSPKLAKDVALCVVARWENLGALAEMRPTEKGFQVLTRNPVSWNVQLLADIYESGGGSETRYFKGFVFGEEAADRALANCQQTN